MESAGREEANRRKWLAFQDHVHQHQLDSHHPSYGTCTHARPSDGNLTHQVFFLMGQIMHEDIGSIPISLSRPYPDFWNALYRVASLSNGGTRLEILTSLLKHNYNITYYYYWIYTIYCVEDCCMLPSSNTIGSIKFKSDQICGTEQDR